MTSTPVTAATDTVGATLPFSIVIPGCDASATVTVPLPRGREEAEHPGVRVRVLREQDGRLRRVERDGAPPVRAIAFGFTLVGSSVSPLGSVNATST